MSIREIRGCDVTGVESGDIKTGVPFTFNGKTVELDLSPDAFDALDRVATDKNGDLLRELFAPETPQSRRSHDELEAIRADARAAGLDVKPTGRLSNEVEKWNVEVRLPRLAAEAAENAAEGTENGAENTEGDSTDSTDEGSTEGNEGEAPTPRRRR